jgi:hypothetical protein
MAAAVLLDAPMIMAPQAIYFKLEDLSLKLYPKPSTKFGAVPSSRCIV